MFMNLGSLLRSLSVSVDVLNLVEHERRLLNVPLSGLGYTFLPFWSLLLTSPMGIRSPPYVDHTSPRRLLAGLA